MGAEGPLQKKKKKMGEEKKEEKEASNRLVHCQRVVNKLQKQKCVCV